MNAIEITNLSKRFNKQVVLNQISLAVPQGIVMGLVGNNGSGKSVLMKCICGLVTPDQGEIIVLGKQIGKDMDFPTDVGALIERPGFLPNRSGYENLYSLWQMRPNVPKSAISEKISMVGLNPDDRKPVGKYSLGMRQRLGIALTLLNDPEILILDEPFNGLDRNGTLEMRVLFKELHANGKTILIASHNPEDIRELCDHCCEIDGGKLAQI